jgi:hypothetical protein
MNDIVIAQKIVKTRKEHRCWGCGTSYPAGTEMEHIVSVVEDTFGRAYYCKICVKVMEEHRKEIQYWDNGTIGYRELKQEFTEYYDKETP